MQDINTKDLELKVMIDSLRLSVYKSYAGGYYISNNEIEEKFVITKDELSSSSIEEIHDRIADYYYIDSENVSFAERRWEWMMNYCHKSGDNPANQVFWGKAKEAFYKEFNS